MSDSNRVDEDDIEVALSQFQAFRNHRLRRLIDILPVAIVVATTIFVGVRWYTGHTQQLAFLGGLTGGLAAVVAILIARELLDRFPRALLVIWRRNVLRLRTAGTAAAALLEGEEGSQEVRLAAKFREFISWTEDRLNSRFGLLLGLLFTLIVLIFVPLLGPNTPSEWTGRFRDDPPATSISLLIRLTFYASGFLGGLLIWRVVTIAQQIHALGNEFDFNLQYGHPDNCGGLRPIGDLCLTIGLILSPLLLLVGGWLVLITVMGLSPVDDPAVQLTTVVATLQILLVPLAILSLIGFFQPLTTAHAAMQRAKLHLENEFESISQQIHRLGSELVNNARTLSADEGAKLEEKIDFLRRVYERSSRIPTWPIDTHHVWRYASVQVVPAIGLATSIIGTLRGFLGSF